MEEILVSPQLLEHAPLKIKFFTAAYSPEVDNYLNEVLEKFVYEDLTKVREITGVPSLFLSSSKDILFAIPYKEIILTDEFVLKRINHMEESILQSFSNWEKVIEGLREKGYKIGIG